jgi:peptidoglycan/LPS O-acetylase OafA/YrhL
MIDSESKPLAVEHLEHLTTVAAPAVRQTQCDEAVVQAAGTPTTPVANTRHLNHVEGLRALAALTVYVNHAFAQVTQIEGHHGPTGLLSLFPCSMVTGHMSVTVFIAISGFCLSLPVSKNGSQLRGGAIDFFRRRARRILPAYYGSVAMCLVLIWTVIGKPTGTLWDFPLRVDRTAIVSHLCLAQDLFATSRINYVFWSIAVEWHIYFLFPLLVASWRRLGPTFTVAVALIGGYAFRSGFEGTRYVRGNPHYVGIFALGMLAAYATQAPNERYARLRDSTAWVPVAITSAAVTAILMGSWGVDLSVKRFHLLDFPVGVLATSILVISARSQEGWLARALSWKPLVFVGTFSYSVYLVHAPLLQIVWQYALRPLGLADNTMFVAEMTLGLAFVVGVAFLFSRVFEVPFMGTRAK